MMILDTDIGSDVDDAMALGVLLGSPELAPFAITTVYGDTVLRAQLASRLASLSSRPGPERIIAGRRETISGKPVWWAGHEGKRYADLDREPIDDATDAVSHLTEWAAAHPGELDILAVGPLTNIAACLDADPSFAANVRRVVIMGGDFRPAGQRVTEHNIASDVTAAQRVFASGIDIAVGGLDLTMTLTVGPALVDRIAGAGRFGAALAEEIAEWLAFLDEPENTPHDPILAIYLADPGLFRTRRASVTVTDDGVTHDAEAGDGRVTIIDGMDTGRVLDEIVRRICDAR